MRPSRETVMTALLAVMLPSMITDTVMTITSNKKAPD